MYKRIRELREDNDLLQRNLAEYLHCSQVAYSRYETGARDIPTNTLIALAKFYDTSVDYILGLTDEKWEKEYSHRNYSEIKKGDVKISSIFTSPDFTIRR